MDKILLNEMEFYGYHGVFQEENKLGQRFRVSVELHLDLRKSGQSDQLEDSVNYAEIYSITKSVVEGEPRNLVEAVAEDIASRILETFNAVKSCKITLIKPDPPIPGHYRSVAVEINRSR
ncbi:MULTISPECIES: dihydroneopterin aldolase [Rossellomorea]|uniref:dihydroneopterin aldolase n=1 Tax=Rossellomorea TaxID=2837508 RepID=UPI001CCA4B1F|nr:MULTISPECIES: dihydroneopterin aldolase [Rossellomorea]MCA0151227.1 dihydroneopterin aldolase [Rossellomorea vietnamensis]UTE77825.1 dihydroneopterin aldolase [Rossellomorea sp. KS-H15a]WGG45767.1 dihydroneopterin aldolase [Rossellomorea sp. DA94]